MGGLGFRVSGLRLHFGGVFSVFEPGGSGLLAPPENPAAAPLGKLIRSSLGCPAPRTLQRRTIPASIAGVAGVTPRVSLPQPKRYQQTL